jgi:hypothetical protein
MDDFIKTVEPYEQVDWFFWLWRNNEGAKYFENNIGKSWWTIDKEWAIDKIKSNLPSHHRIAALETGDRIPCPEVTGPRVSLNVDIDGVWGQIKSLHLVDLLRRGHEQVNGPYDLIIRSRVDLNFYDGQPNYQRMVEELNKDPSIIFTSANQQSSRSLPFSDLCFMSSPQTMNVFCDLSEHLFKYNREGVHFHQETMFGHHAYMNNLKVIPGNFMAMIRGSNINGVSKFGRWV